MAITITVGNYKGGVGKTKNAVLTAYHLAKKGYKTLVVDLDPQGNATIVLSRTKKNESNEIFTMGKTLMTAITEENLSAVKTNIMDNLYMLPSFIDFSNYGDFLEQKFGTLATNDKGYKDLVVKKMSYLKLLLEPFQDEFDYIIIDVPPTKSIITDSAVFASNFILLVLQTQELSLNGAVLYVNDLRDLILNYNINIEICGILPVLLEHDSTIDRLVLELAKEKFGEDNIFENIVPHMRRLKRFDNTGITCSDHHDSKVHDLYSKITDEMIERIKELS